MQFLHILYHDILPYAIALGSFVLLIQLIERAYMRRNEDKTVKRALAIIVVVATLSLTFVFFHWFMSVPMGQWLASFLHGMGTVLAKTPILGFITTWFINFKSSIIALCSRYFFDYLNAFLLVYFFGAMIALAGLKWRINFYRALNVILSVVIRFPLLVFQYFSGYQTPIKDKILQGVLKDKIRENLNDSYERAVDDIDDRGKKFEDGAGGTAATQTKKATAVAIRRATVTVKTAAGQRKAHLLVKQSRETETDRSIENSLKGLGSRISGDSIYFPADPIYSSNEKGYIFDSIVSYEPAKELGSFTKIFNNPFEQQNKVSLGGKGSLQVFIDTLKNFWVYIRHLTPIAIENRIENSANERFTRDNSLDHAKYKIQQNLDLSVIPVPRDNETGNTIEEQRELALRTANSRIDDVKRALNSFKLSGQFMDVQVGGNTAVYRFSMPPDATLPDNFDQVQDKIGNLLHIAEKPIITLKAGILSVSLNNGVNIPVSFTDMIKNRKKGASCIISGMAGVDAMNEPIYFELGDKNPHAILFGKTGTGKTVTIFTIIYSVMSATDPKHLRIAYCDGKGNSFEFMKLDGEHPNPYLYAPPADASGDIEYARALIAYMEKECRDRIDLFKHEAVAKLSEYNEKHPDDPLPEILFVCDEFSAITQQDKNLKASEMVKKGTIDKFEYLAKMARSVGIRLLLANQSARKELVPGKIAANITGRVSLGVSEPIEAEIALPETGIKVNLVNQPGEFYSIMNGPTHPEHGNSPYIPQKVANVLNDKLTEKFGKAEYVKTRDQIMEETGFAEKKDDKSSNDEVSDVPGATKDMLSENSKHSVRSSRSTSTRSRFGTSHTVNKSTKTSLSVKKAIAKKENIIAKPEKKLTVETPLAEICRYANASGGKYIPYLKQNLDIVNNNKELNSIDDNTRKNAMIMQTKIKELIDRYERTQKLANASTRTHAHTGSGPVRDITAGKDGDTI